MTEDCKTCKADSLKMCKNCEYRHSRSGEFIKKMDTRMRTVEGHVEAVRKMLDSDDGCVNILIQLMAVEKSIHNIGIAILKNHLNTCLMQSLEEGDTKSIAELDRLLEMYL